MQEQFTNDVLAGLTVKELEFKYNISRTTVYAWKKRWGLTGKSPNAQQRILDRDIETGTKVCSACNKEKPLSKFYSNGYQPNGKQKFKGKCIPCENNSRINTRKDLIREILQELGKSYCCEKCGYSKNSAALCFHHLDPSEKDFGLAQLSKTTKSNVINEIRKCQLLCHNCHMEVHYPHLMIDDA